MGYNMSLQIGLREANQHLAQYIEVVEKGGDVVITRRGIPVAKLVPVEQKARMTTVQQEAWKRTQARMKKGYDLGGKGFARDEFYER